jgi:hypothetical protein
MLAASCGMVGQANRPHKAHGRDNHESIFRRFGFSFLLGSRCQHRCPIYDLFFLVRIYAHSLPLNLRCRVNIETGCSLAQNAPMVHESRPPPSHLQARAKSGPARLPPHGAGQKDSALASLCRETLYEHRLTIWKAPSFCAGATSSDSLRAIPAQQAPLLPCPSAAGAGPPSIRHRR